jgi:SAM-dependent methyltransferase
MTRCAESFTAKQLPTATAACYRRAREQQIDSDAKRVLYNLARSYEDTKQWHDAISHFQLLSSWDISYRNAWERLEHLTSIYGAIHAEDTPRRADYTGLTISLLGPNAPRDVDDALKDVLRARTAEVLIQQGERERVAEIINTLRANERFCRGITGTGLEYDQELFLKYDYALPEDETKKFLETVNLLYLLKKKTPIRTLDIGSATGRYPMLMRWLGAEAWGIDIEERAIEYAKAQLAAVDEWPRYLVADACALPFPDPQFELITCMMGTFAHIPLPKQQDVLVKAFGALLPGGNVAISTWDMECRHLAYLSIYNEKQKDMIRVNSPSEASMRAMLERAGFVDIQVRPFCMLPQIIVYDLGIESLRSGDIQLAAQADLAVRSLYPHRHGEMFLAFGRKPENERQI